MTTLKEEEPFAFVLNAEFLHNMCSFCFSLASLHSVSKCKGCHMLSYCNSNCQKKDWANHKKECQLLKSAKEASGTVPGANVRLVARILLKSETSLAQKAFNGRSWEDLNAELRPMTEEMASACNSQIDGIVDFLKPLKIVSREEATKAFHKILNHNIDIFFIDKIEEVIGIGIYLGLSAHKHSCIPDAQLLFQGKKSLLRSYNKEAIYSKDVRKFWKVVEIFQITYSYTPGTPSFVYQKNAFKLKYFTDCSCPICVDENHIVNRMGSSCRSTCCQNAAGILDFPFFVCSNCGADCELTVKEVRHAEGKIVEFLAKSEEEVYRMSFMEIKKLVHDSEQVLSKFNFRFLTLCEKVANGGGPYKKEGGEMVRKRLFDVMLSGYSYYLPDTHKFMVRSLIDRALLKLMLDYLDEFDVNRALDAAMGAYGQHHCATGEVRQLFGLFKRINAKERDKQFREAGKLNW